MKLRTEAMVAALPPPGFYILFGRGVGVLFFLFITTQLPPDSWARL